MPAPFNRVHPLILTADPTIKMIYLDVDHKKRAGQVGLIFSVEDRSVLDKSFVFL